MIYSMTGFGKASAIVNNKKITAEVKSLNSKQLDLAVKLPVSFRQVEMEMRNAVATRLQRGKVEVFISVEPIEGMAPFTLNLPLLIGYKEQIEQMAKELRIAPPTDWYATLLRLPDVTRSELNSEELTQDEHDALIAVLNNAIDALIEFREQEGKRLQQFFEEKIQAIRDIFSHVPEYEESRVEKIKTRIADALDNLDGISVDKNRFEQELIFYIEKLDITEEKIRLQNHLNYFIATLDIEPGQGKKLGFITQEMGREINTMGSKANEAQMQKLVVMMKDQLEQIKEQVLNVL